MISALPLFVLPTEGSSHISPQTDGFIPGQFTPSGTQDSGNAFLKILEGRQLGLGALPHLPSTGSQEHRQSLPEAETPSDLLVFLPAALINQGRPAEFSGEASLGVPGRELEERPLGGKSQSVQYPVAVSEVDELDLPEWEGVQPGKFTSGSPLMAYEYEPLNKAKTSGELVKTAPRGLNGDEGSHESLRRFPGEDVIKESSPDVTVLSKIPVTAGLVEENTPIGKNSVHNASVRLIPSSNRQQVLGEAIKDPAQSIHKFQGEPVTESQRPERESGKILEKPPERTTTFISKPDDLLGLRPPLTPARNSQAPSTPGVSQAFQSAVPFEQTTAGMAAISQLNLVRFKHVHAPSSLVGELSLPGKESSLSPLSEVMKETGMSSTGDRVKDGVEATGKAMGLDSGGGPGMNNGMGGFSQSQSGFHQNSSAPSTGAHVRMTEERVTDLPAPALQRLQMDVQVSENHRIQIDVGVQQRQVYAGLLMDQGTLRNLAVQFVPQLENQLTQVDMELQEFSAEVRDQGRERESDDSANRPGMSSRRLSDAILPQRDSLAASVKRNEEQGLHFVV